jgi:hypothetical protein
MMISSHFDWVVQCVDGYYALDLEGSVYPEV